MINYLSKSNKRLTYDYGFKNPIVEKNKMATEKEVKENKKQLPVKKFRCGNVTATIWGSVITKNNIEIEVFNTTIVRSYKDESNNWKTVNSYGINDLNKVRLVSEKAFEFLSLKESGLKEE